MSERLAAVFERLYRIGERRQLRRRYYRIYFSLGLFDRLPECRKIMFITYLVELRSAIRQPRFCQKWIICHKYIGISASNLRFVFHFFYKHTCSIGSDLWILYTRSAEIMNIIS